MARRRYFLISKSPNDGWELKEEGSLTVIKNTEKREDLLNYAAEYCGKLYSELVIHDFLGNFEHRRTYGKEPYQMTG